MKRVSKGVWNRKKLELWDKAEALGEGKRLSAVNYGSSGFFSTSYVDESIHFHEWGCDSNRFRTVKAVCMFKVFVYTHYRYYIDEHKVYDPKSNCRNTSGINHALYRTQKA